MCLGQSVTHVPDPADTAPAPPTAFPVVGIGASAGGLDPIKEFLAAVPAASGIAFVVVQHLDPAHVSSLVELLQRVTAMKVLQAENRMKVEPDTVYVIPPDRDLTVGHGILRLVKPSIQRGLRLPIDTFLRSLAADRREAGVGVILSGMGSDGTLGIKAIKEHSGAVFVQSPDSAKFDGMPVSAIATGAVDAVAPAGELPGLIAAYLRLPTWKDDVASTLEKSAGSEIDEIVDLLKSRSGNDFSMYKRGMISRRIERRMCLQQISEVAEYLRLLKESPGEITLLGRDLLINVTSFFRDPEVWRQLRKQILPRLLKDCSARAAPFRAWIPGCATGEEAYSLAMVVMEAMAATATRKWFPVQLFATDLAVDAIDQARVGLFPAAVAEHVSAERLRRFFDRDEHGYRVKIEIREMITFAPHNLATNPPFSRMDLVTCRNLMIYLAPELQKKVFQLFHFALNPGGILLLGTAESINQHADLFAPLPGANRFFHRLVHAQRQGELTEMHAGLASVKEFSPAGAKSLVPVSGGKGRRRRTAGDAPTEPDSLLRARHELQSLREEMQSSDEELRSTIEELQSSNEELVSSKEEMQSMNEEMQTINRELQLNMEEQSRLNSDLANLMNSTRIATVFLDRDLNIRRFTPEMTRLVKLRPADLGRPLSDLASELPYPELVDDSREVIRTLSAVERVLPAGADRWFLIRVIPYLATDQVLDGVVITFTDIAEIKRTEKMNIMARGVLEILNRSQETTDAIREILPFIRNSLGFEAVGIRLREGDDFPYFVTSGFSEEFVAAERCLCIHDELGRVARDAAGNPMLECMCGNILRGRTNPAQPFFTPGGSFWTNSTTDLLTSTSESDRQARTRNRCNSEGYESVALVPLKNGNEIIGLLQVNDRRRDRLSLVLVTALEGLGLSVGTALQRQQAREELRQTSRMLEARLRIFEYAVEHSLEEVLVKILDECEDLTGSCIGFYHFVEADQKTLSLQAWSTRTAKEYCRAEGQGMHYSIDQAGVWTDCVRTMEPVIHNDYASLPHKKGLPEGHATLTRELVVPILRGNGIVAILGVGNKPGDYTEHDIGVVTYLADIAWQIVVHKREEARVRELLKAVEEEKEKLRESEAFNLSIIESSVDCIKVLDLDGNLLSMSAGGQRLLEIADLSTVINHSWIDFWPEADRPSVRAAVSEARAGRNGFFHAYCPSATGKPLWWDVIVSPIMNKRHQPCRLLAVSREISAQINAEKDRSQLQAQLLQSQKMESVGRLAGGVAHDFNNLLTVVKSNLSMIKGEHCDKCPHAELLNEIGEAAERATELTGRLLAFSRQNIDKIRACDLTELVLELRRMLTRVIGEDILIEIATSGHSILCQIDRGLFEQMLVNLAVNARDAMPRGGVFRLTTGIVPHDGVLDVAARDGMVARISASDTGGGIERENLDRIFEPFFTTKEVGKGTGLGLAMAYGVVKQHGGEIQVRSEVGQGTTFEIHLPLCEKRTAEPAFEPTPVKVAPGRSPATAATILLVEDEASVRRVTKRALEKIGHRVIEAVDPEEALASANNPALEFDLVLSDIVMPGMNGLDLMTRIKEIRPGMKSLFMSGYAKEEILSRISTDSSIEYLPKPFTIDELAAKIKGVLEKG